MNLALVLERAAKSNPDQPAVASGARVALSYGDLARRVARLAGGLRDVLGLNSGDRVAIVAQNSIHYIEMLYAVWHAGLVAVPTNAKLHASEIHYVLEHSGARACFVSSGLRDS